MVRVVRLLASVPSVIWGLLGILVLVPFVGNHLITLSERTSLEGTVQLTGAGLAVAVVLLTLMISPIMIALICDALAAVPGAWREGAAALGVNRLRAIRAVTLRAVRPAIVAATVLATARALGEAIMISMVSGSNFFAPRPSDGVAFFYEPLRTLASTIVDFREGLGGAPALSSACTRARCCCCSPSACCRSPPTCQAPLRKYQVTRGMSTFVSDRVRSAGASLPSREQGLRAAVGAPRCAPGAGATALCGSPPGRAGLTLCAVAAAILLYMGYRGIQYLRPELIFSRPQASLDQSGSGGFLDPLLGTMLLTVIGIAIAAPLAICCALWIVEYGRPRWLTRVVESGIEIVAGTPDILIAVFGLAVFQLHFLAFASSAPNGGGSPARPSSPPAR